MVPYRPRPGATGASRRSRTGCLTCRLRRKKCDEDGPVCVGCKRNHLICQWPSTTTAKVKSTAHEVIRSDSHDTVDDQGVCQDVLDDAELSPRGNSLAPHMSTVPRVLREENNRRLLDYFMTVTAKRMAGKTVPENPFLTYNIKISLDSDILQHGILAITASHLSYRDPSMTQISRTHYAVALRGVKYAMTRWQSCSVTDRISLLAGVFSLCWFEVMDADTGGTLYHHLRASHHMLLSLRAQSATPDDDLFGFFAEQYSYLAVVSNISFRPEHFDRRIHQALPFASLSELNQGKTSYGCLFGCSHQLYESIPLICELARIRMIEADGQSSFTIGRYRSILSSLQSWKVEATFVGSGFDHAGRVYQQACTIFLITAFHGSRGPTAELFAEVEPCLDRFLIHLSQLSYESAAWTTVMWPILVAGSCMRCREQRDGLLKLIVDSTFEMRAVQNMQYPLSLIWSEMDKNADIYGPNGLESVLGRYKVHLCVG